MTIGRPPNTQPGDVLLLVVRWTGTFSKGAFTQLGSAKCEPVADGSTPETAGFLWWGYRIATETDQPSWGLGSSNTALGEAVLVAVGGARGVPLEDAKSAVFSSSAASAPSVVVQSDVARLFSVFASPAAGGIDWPTPAGLDPVASTEGLAVFTTLHPKGPSPVYGMPDGTTASCSLAASVALGPR